ncbi:hypothetical protein LguiB_013937 [Lonicera macranthoides]
MLVLLLALLKRAIHPPNMPTAAASTSAADLARNYEVFLSFRGPDTRESFTDFLYTYLVGAGIHTFRDNNELRIGEEVSPELPKAIKESKISIPIFSKDYASSEWCLLELAQMVECHANEGQKIFPIFYDVDPSDVRNQKGSYKEAFRLHEKKFDKKTVQRWRDALRTVGQMKGYELDKETNGYEGELVKKVVRSVLLQLKKNYTHVPDELGTKYVEALNLDFGAVEQDKFEQLESYGNRLLLGQEFGKLPSLRFLRVGYANLNGDFNHLLSKLRWLEWSYRGKFTPTNLHLKNLVILDLSGSHSTITDNWEGWSQFKMANKLKVLNLSYCKGLSRGPNFSTFTTLERLIIRTVFFEEINPSLGNLRTLRILDLVSCKFLETLDCSTFEALESLDLRSCESLRQIIGLNRLESLTHLNISFCHSLERLPNLSSLKKLKELVMRFCPKLTKIEGVDKLESLKLWNMRRCSSIEKLPSLSNLRILKELDLRDCSNLREVEEFGDLESLENLNMLGCYSLERLPDLSKLKKLKNLCLSKCRKLREVESLGNLESLESLSLSSCISLQKTVDLSNLKKLKNLNLLSLENLTQIMGIEELESLESLDISNCKSIEKLPNLSNLKKLKDLDAFECEKLAEIKGLEELKSLTSLKITGCKSLENLPHLPNTRIWQMYKDASEFFKRESTSATQKTKAEISPPQYPLVRKGYEAEGGFKQIP